MCQLSRDNLAILVHFFVDFGFNLIIDKIYFFGYIDLGLGLELKVSEVSTYFWNRRHAEFRLDFRATCRLFGFDFGCILLALGFVESTLCETYEKLQIKLVSLWPCGMPTNSPIEMATTDSIAASAKHIEVLFDKGILQGSTKC